MTSVESKLSEALKDHFRIYFPSRETVEKSIGGLGVSKVLGLPSTSSTSYRSQFFLHVDSPESFAVRKFTLYEEHFLAS